MCVGTLPSLRNLVHINVLTEFTISGLWRSFDPRLPIFLYICEIKSESWLGTRLSYSNKDNSKTALCSTHLDFSTKLILIIAYSFSTTKRLHSLKVTWSKALFGCCPLRRTPFSNVVRMRTCTLVFQTKGHGHWSESKTSAHVKLRVDQPTYGWHGLFQ